MAKYVCYVYPNCIVAVVISVKKVISTIKILKTRGYSVEYGSHWTNMVKTGRVMFRPYVQYGTD